MAEKVFLNDNLVDADAACVSATDSGLLYGAGLFETMRCRNGRVFALNDHLDRLFMSASKLAVANPFTREFLSEAIEQVLRANGLRDARLRLTLTNGPLIRDEEQRKPTLLIAATGQQGYPAQYYDRGVTVVLSPYRQNPADPTHGHKTTSYLPRMLGLSWARERQAAEALWFTTDNRLAEGCISNVFLVKDSVLLTPPLSTPVLPGIARKTVCQIASDEKIELSEKDLFINDLLEADEVFLTNVIMETLPVIQVEKHTIADGKVGPMAKRLKRAFEACIDHQCGGPE